MRQGILPFVVEPSLRGDDVTARAGLLLVVECLRALGYSKMAQRHLNVQKRKRGFSDGEKLEALVAMLAAGGECLDDVKVLAADRGLCRLWSRRVPSADSLRRYLYAFHDEGLMEAGRKEMEARGGKAFIPEESKALRGLGRLNEELVASVAAKRQLTRATLDLDATIIESAKKESLWHYKGGRGYQPVAVLWAEADMVVADQFRDGNVPAGMGNLPVIKKAFAAIPESVEELSFRADSACYEEKVLKWLSDEGREGGRKGIISFTISADMTPELREECKSLSEDEWKRIEDRPDETVDCTDVVFQPGDWPKNAKPLRYVAVRIRKKEGNIFSGGYDTKYLAVVSNRFDIEAAELLRWHWKKAGTIEHLHDVMKNELGAGTMPCGRFGANAAWYRIAVIAYNALSALKHLALSPELRTSRPKRLRFAVFTVAGRITKHAGKLILRISTRAEKVAGLIAARLALARLYKVPVPSG